MGQRFAIHLLKVSPDLVSGFLLHVALLAYTRRKISSVSASHSNLLLLWRDLVTSWCVCSVYCTSLQSWWCADISVNADAKFCMFQKLALVLTAPLAYYIQNLLCIYFLVYLFIYFFTYWLIHWLIDSFIHSFSHSIIHSFPQHP